MLILKSILQVLLLLIIIIVTVAVGYAAFIIAIPTLLLLGVYTFNKIKNISNKRG